MAVALLSPTSSLPSSASSSYSLHLRYSSFHPRRYPIHDQLSGAICLYDSVLILGSWKLCRSKGTVGTGARVPSARRARVLVSCSCTPTSRNRRLERRQLVLSGLVSSFAIILPISGEGINELSRFIAIHVSFSSVLLVYCG